MFDFRLVFSLALSLLAGQALADIPECVTDSITISESPSLNPGVTPGVHSYYEIVGGSERECSLAPRHKDSQGRYYYCDGYLLMPGQTCQDGKNPKVSEPPKAPKTPGSGSSSGSSSVCYKVNGRVGQLSEVCTGTVQFYGNPRNLAVLANMCVSYELTDVNRQWPAAYPFSLAQCSKEPEKDPKEPPKDNGKDEAEGKDGEKGNKGDQGGDGKDGESGNASGTVNNTTNNNTTNNNGGAGNGEGFEDKNDMSGFCKENPDALACAKVPQDGEDGDGWDGLLVRKEIPVFGPGSKAGSPGSGGMGSNGILGQAGAGICPAPEVVGTRWGSLSFEWTAVCDILAKVRGMVIALFAFFGILIVFKGMK